MLGRMSRLAYLTSRIPCASQLFSDKETKTPRGWLCQHCFHGPRRGSEAAQAEEEGGDRDKWQAPSYCWDSEGIPVADLPSTNAQSILFPDQNHLLMPPPSRVTGRQETSLGYKQILSESSKTKPVQVRAMIRKTLGGGVTPLIKYMPSSKINFDALGSLRPPFFCSLYLV